MMTQSTAAPQDDEIYVALDRDVSGQVIPQNDKGRFAKLTPAQLAEVSRVAQTAGLTLLENIRKFENRPSKIVLEFGISAGAEGGVPFVTKGTLEAQFKVVFEWESRTAPAERET